MKTKTEVALKKFSETYNCAQAVLFSFCDDLRFDKDVALRMACGFGAGMARKQEVCGAISGGILTIGLKHGRGEGQERTVTEKTYGKVRDLIARFESKHGSCLCRALLNGCDLNTKEGNQHFKDNDLLNKTCKGCVKTVVEALEEIL
ncbi:MAG: C-GCAxxG-C-C family protein [Candidatus Omnitrophota bacterium]